MDVISYSYNEKGELFSNSYILIDGDNCVVIDPSHPSDNLIKTIKEKELNLKGVLLTHAHFDHIQGVDRLCDCFKCPLFLEADDVPLLTDSIKNCSSMYRKPIIVKAEPNSVYDGYTIDNLLSKPIKVIHTPFHTKGSCCYYIESEDLLFSGDTLFKFVIGRSDLPTSCPRKTNESLRKLKKLPFETRVLPGHGSETTIGNELKLNRFLRES